MRSRHPEDSQPAHEARGKRSLGQDPYRRSSGAVLFALVVVGFAVMFASESALGAEPETDAASAEVITMASLGHIDIGNPPRREISAESPCSSDQCRPLRDEDSRAAEGATSATSSTPVGNWKRDQSPVRHARSHLARLTGTEGSHLDLRILRPLYATVAMPSQPGWSPMADRPIVQRILVGFRFVVPF